MNSTQQGEAACSAGPPLCCTVLLAISQGSSLTLCIQLCQRQRQQLRLQRGGLSSKVQRHQLRSATGQGNASVAGCGSVGRRRQ